MSRLVIAFLRHGDYFQLPDVPSALQPFALSEPGKQQAKKAAETLLSVCQENQWQLFPVIDSSSLLRSWQTATLLKEAIQEQYSISLTVDSFESLCERSVGNAANLTTAQIESVLKNDPRYETPPDNWKSNSHYCLPLQGAESLMQSGQRVAKHILTQVQKLQSEIVQDTLKIFVGHGASFRHAAYHLNILEFEQIAQLSLFHAQPLFFEIKTQDSFVHIAGEWKVRNHHSTFRD